MNQRGASATEYAIIVTAVAAAIVIVLSLFGQQLTILFEKAASLFAVPK